MIRRSLKVTLAVCLLVMLFPGGAVADTVFFDDFGDGSLTNDLPLASDGIPVKWTGIDDGIYDASSRDLVMMPVQPETGRYMSADARDFQLTDVSIRVQGRVTGGSAPNTSQLILTARNQLPEDTQHYVGGIGYFPNLGGTVLFIGKNDVGVSYRQFGGNPVVPFDIRFEDAVVQLDVIGDRISLWAWRAGDPPPVRPQLTARDTTYTTAGFVRIAGHTGTGGDSETIFRFVHVADTHIPEPSSFVLTTLACAGLLIGRSRKVAKSH